MEFPPKVDDIVRVAITVAELEFVPAGWFLLIVPLFLFFLTMRLRLRREAEPSNSESEDSDPDVEDSK